MTDPGEEWRADVDPFVDRLRDFYVSGRFPLDYSAESLRHLESAFVDRFVPGADPSFTESVVAYLGETLRRLSGGEWEWDTQADVPVVVPGTHVGPGVIVPTLLMGQAVQTRAGTIFTEVADRLPALPSQPAAPERPGSVHPLLADWLADRAAKWSDWAADTGHTWDFSVDSLDALEALVLRRTPTLADFTAPTNADFVQGAAWYLGEVGRRHRATTWQYHEDPLGYELSGDAWANTPYISQPGPDAHSLIPLSTLRVAVKTATPGTTRTRFAWLTA
ncbi:hypothetical protein [Actinokineospora globicatena]|uniref:Uncharacterized protein n=1 Tax=Actinokineospora globicatena TaxID=103729 RepID=A0A9W6QME7_9PSEU|nr:hypothetical protein [Actinokineospora globicatena]GLW91237.1 hypothetical protein Aglo03_20530 [Actinokineospora globicatena]